MILVIKCLWSLYFLFFFSFSVKDISWCLLRTYLFLCFNLNLQVISVGWFLFQMSYLLVILFSKRTLTLIEQAPLHGYSLSGLAFSPNSQGAFQEHPEACGTSLLLPLQPTVPPHMEWKEGSVLGPGSWRVTPPSHAFQQHVVPS